MTANEFIRRKAPRWPIVLLRLFAGYYFLTIGVRRIIDLMSNDDVLRDHLGRLAAADQIIWFRHYMDAVVVPIRDTFLFNLLMSAGPLLLGLCLVAGFLSRTSTLLGIVMLLNVYLVKFTTGTPYEMLFLQTQIAVLAVLCLSVAGRTLGLDGVFWRNRILLKMEPPEEGEAGAKKTRQPDEPTFRDVESIGISEKVPTDHIEHSQGFFADQFDTGEAAEKKPGRIDGAMREEKFSAPEAPTDDDPTPYFGRKAK